MSDRVVAVYGIGWPLNRRYFVVLVLNNFLILVILSLLMIRLFYMFTLMSWLLCVNPSGVVLSMFVMLLRMFVMLFVLFHPIVNLFPLNLLLAHVHIPLHFLLVANVLPNRKYDDPHTNQRKGPSANGYSQNDSLTQSFGIKAGVGCQRFFWLVTVGWLVLRGIVCRSIVGCGIVRFRADKLQLSGDQGVGWQGWLSIQGLPGSLQESVAVGLCWGHLCATLYINWPLR